MPGKHVVVAMSGGVDSSVTAYLLKEAGYQVTGVHMILSDNTSESNIRDLEKTCEMLDIPFHKLDFRAEFEHHVTSYFCREYALGHTPNPCILCNERIKFGFLLRWAQDNGADYLATGHYARIESSGGGYCLLRATYRDKDQSYFLYRVGQEVLKHVILPLGTWKKDDVRHLAASLGLPASDKHDSEDLCFVPEGDYRSFIASHLSSQPGDIVDTHGVILGSHEGLIRYTVGQRQGFTLKVHPEGLGISSNSRLYVLELDVAKNQLVVGTKEEMVSPVAPVHELSWISGEVPEDLKNVTAKIRSRSPEIPVKLYIKDENAQVEFALAQVAVTPGQSIVFYQGDVVLGGGIIARKKKLKDCA